MEESWEDWLRVSAWAGRLRGKKEWCTVSKGFDERVIAGLRGGRHAQQAELGEGSLEMNVGKWGNDGEGIFDGSRGKRFARPSRT